MSTETVTVKPYVQFVAQLKAACDAAGIPLTESQGTTTGLRENQNWVCLESAINGHKIYVPKNAGPVKNLETTIPCLMLTGSIPMPKANGKIIGRFQPVVNLVVNGLLPLMGDTSDRLPENRRPTKGA